MLHVRSKIVSSDSFCLVALLRAAFADLPGCGKSLLVLVLSRPTLSDLPGCGKSLESTRKANQHNNGTLITDEFLVSSTCRSTYFQMVFVHGGGLTLLHMTYM